MQFREVLREVNSTGSPADGFPYSAFPKAKFPRTAAAAADSQGEPQPFPAELLSPHPSVLLLSFSLSGFVPNAVVLLR